MSTSVLSSSSSGPSVQHPHIVATADTCHGQPRVDGTRIRVWDIYWCYEREGMQVDQIIALYPQLTPSNIHAALSYYWDHREQLHQHHQNAVQQLEQYRGQHESMLKTRLKQKNGS
ncbi:MAG: DUF433 domain-containing protein [Planctomycetia bacterium]|nr:DUF433 domain-containing protein [Planctomycetia bacterium]